MRTTSENSEEIGNHEHSFISSFLGNETIQENAMKLLNSLKNIDAMVASVREHIESLENATD